MTEPKPQNPLAGLVEEAPSTPQWWRRFFMFDTRILHHLHLLWQSRYLVYALTIRGIRARYKQSALGIGWALLTPIAMTAVIVYMYSALKIDVTKGGTFPAPKVVYFLMTLSFWNFFTKAVTNGSTSLVSNMDLVTKVYFPREVLPISSILTNAVDLFLSFTLWVIVAAGVTYFMPDLKETFPNAYPFLPHWRWLWLPFFLVVIFMFISGIVFITSAMQVYFRDVSHLLNLGLMLWLFITPVMYPLKAFPGGRYTAIININPMTGIIDGLRLALISRVSPIYTDGNFENHVIGAVIFSVFIFLAGYAFFKHEERYFADVV